ncbi:hypothetical protein G3I40_26760 [Streptomyces sp. SID14478]|uniref:hypothetical protein n=1 Tax=Streptomyces sp. SID14478 TaxID=2706073 RepID=UPI0013DC536B|nr:hypothetical protein [Streptomyces sp. SID14478]NEB78791.1 hypothetical protein [Streptomyces sp. SID14478]
MHQTNVRPGAFPTLRVTSALAAAGMITAAVVVWQRAQLDANALIDFIALAIVATAIAVGAAAWATWALKQRIRTAAARSLSSVIAIGVVIAVAAATLSAWAFTDPHGLYARSYGGAGQCLADTPYASDRVHIVHADKAQTGAPLEIRSQDDTKNEALRFEDGKDKLIPADSHTRQTIREHAC